MAGIKKDQRPAPPRLGLKRTVEIPGAEGTPVGQQDARLFGARGCEIAVTHDVNQIHLPGREKLHDHRVRWISLKIDLIKVDCYHNPKEE